jgi:nucleoside-diphosphate-sugar epimerase
LRAALALEGSHCINLAGPEPLSLRRIGETIGRAVGAAPVFETDGEAARGNLVADISRMRRRLVAPSVPFERGLKDLVGEARKA